MKYPIATLDYDIDAINKANNSMTGWGEEMPKHTGWIHLFSNESGVSYFFHLVDGYKHRDLGPAMIMEKPCTRYNRGWVPDEYYLCDRPYAPLEYWTIMYDLHKGTKHEAFCLSQILGAE